jgi:hypothetical protein
VADPAAFIEGSMVEINAQTEKNQANPDTTGFIIAPLVAAVALDAASR